MEDWEKALREKLENELEEKMYQIGEGDFIAFTGKQGKIDFEVSLDKTLREVIKGKNEKGFDKK